MSSTVNIPFRKRLEAGETSFVVTVPRQFLSTQDRTYGFQTITLMPEYQSQQAYIYNMDPKSELNTEVEHNFRLDVKLQPNFYQQDQSSRTYSAGIFNTWDVLKSINAHFETNKPLGTLYSPIVFDWISLLSLGNGTVREYHKANAQHFYEEEYREHTHGNILPVSVSQMQSLNNLPFPTTTNEDVLDEIRIRIHLAPNVSIAFSNEILLKIIGMAPDQIPMRNAKNQLAYSNISVDAFDMKFCSEPPMLTILPGALKTAKVHVNPTMSQYETATSVFKTTRGRERKVSNLAEDYNNSLSGLGKNINFYISLEYNTVTKKFKINYPNNDHVAINIKTSPIIARQLGFGALDVIPFRMVPSEVSDDIDVHEIEKKARALVHDTGMVYVDLDQQRSILNSYSGNTTMAMLEPVYDGIMRNPPHVELPRTHVTYFDPELKFVLKRFGDDDQPYPLDWVVGAYVQGVIIGKE